MFRVLFILLIVCGAGCDNAHKVLQLEKTIDADKQTILRQKTELADMNEKIKMYISQEEEAGKELNSTLEKNKKISIILQDLENTINNLTEQLGKEGLILPAYLIGRSIVLYTQPYDDAQIFIGTTRKIQHGDSIMVEDSQNHQLIKVPFNNIIGYRLLKEQTD